MSDFNKICLEKYSDERRGYINYGEAYKIDFDHYKKVLDAKWNKSCLNLPANVRFEERNKEVSKDEIQEGDFISCCCKKGVCYLGHRFKSYVQMDEHGLFVIEWRTSSNSNDANFIAYKHYMKIIGGIELIWRDLEINSENLFD